MATIARPRPRAWRRHAPHTTPGMEEGEPRREEGPRGGPGAGGGGVKPGRAREFGMYLDGHWYRLHIDPEFIPDDDPVRRLDVSLLQDNLLGPILGIEDPRRDKRIDFVGGIRGLQELERRVDSGEMAGAFAIFPTSMADLMGVADAGEVMPPKATWFEPKLADGLVWHLLD